MIDAYCVSKGSCVTGCVVIYGFLTLHGEKRIDSVVFSYKACRI